MLFINLYNIATKKV